VNQGAVVWLTGLPASGKTTLATRIRERMVALGAVAVVLDSDALRPILAPELGYRPAERDEFYRRLAGLAALMAEQGCVAVVAATAPTVAQRARARSMAPRFIEVYLEVSAEECAARDPKGLYARARGGEAPDLPGGGAPYEPPEVAEVVARGGRDEGAADQVVARLLGSRSTPAAGP